jgi:quinol monooxygenase YgiN
VSADARGEVVYEVTLDVEQGIADAYRDWLRTHVADMLALPGFVAAQSYEVREPLASGRVALCVHYRLRDAAALDDYLREHAPRMRAEGAARFGERFRASRRVLVPMRDA